MSLSANAVRFPTAQEVRFLAALTRSPTAPSRVKTSVLEVRDAHDVVVFRSTDGAFFDGAPRTIGLIWDVRGGPRLPKLPPASYTARWIVDGVASNAAPFEIGPEPPPPLTLEVADRGCGRGPPLIAHLYNPGPDVIDLRDVLADSDLIVDGERYRRGAVVFVGNNELAPRQGFSQDLSFDLFSAPLDPGRHTVSLQMKRFRSRPITVNIAR
jgi:hypothetical protein